MMKTTGSYLPAAVAGLFAACPAFVSAGDAAFKVSMRVDLGKDVGQNFGTLFEAFDENGNVIAGAGYLGACNTQARSDRRLLHFYVRPAEDTAFKPQVLPRVSTDAGTYLFEFDDKLFAKARGGTDNKLRVWDVAERKWRVDDTTVPLSIHVGDGVLSATSRAVTYAGRDVLTLPSDQGSIAETYYANGFLVFRRHHRKASPPVNELLACRWTSDDHAAIKRADGRAVPMRTPGEFVYAYGQLAEHVIAATNTGGVYVFDGRAWKVILEPDVNVSFQIYAMINYRDKLLMGQYPTGEIFEYDGAQLKRLPNWPPVMPGVSKRAREAQTLTLYGGDLYAGVWPWAEVWKYDRNRSEWLFMGRMFTHPELTSKTTHPYEQETEKLGVVLNRWGQRVTSMVPLGDALYISTSAKGGAPYEPRFKFLAGDKWKEYGLVYRYRKPGTLCVHTEWKNRPTTFEFQFTGNRMSITQDGKPLGSTSFDAKPAAKTPPHKITWAQGLFGNFRGKIIGHNPTAGTR